MHRALKSTVNEQKTYLCFGGEYVCWCVEKKTGRTNTSRWQTECGTVMSELYVSLRVGTRRRLLLITAQARTSGRGFGIYHHCRQPPPPRPSVARHWYSLYIYTYICISIYKYLVCMYMQFDIGPGIYMFFQD